MNTHLEAPPSLKTAYFKDGFPFLMMEKKLYLCNPTFCLGGGMVDTRDLEMLFEIIICKTRNKSLISCLP